MRTKLRRGFVGASAFGIVLALLGLSMVTPVISSTTDFSIFNSDWNGASALATSTYRAGVFSPSFEVRGTGADIEVVSTRILDMDLDAATTALVVIGPTTAFGDAEASAVGAYVRAGGVLLLADDFGTGNGLLEKMGAGSRFSRLLVMDLAFDKRPEFSVCFDLADDNVTENVTRVLLNYPSSILPGEGAQVLARTSVASWLDRDGDRTQDWGEPRGPFPVLAREAMGLGTIVLLSDPSVLINGMRDQLDNARLADNLVSQICLGRSAVLFDESHRDFFSPVSVTTKFTGGLDTNIKLVLAAFAFVLVLWLSTDLVEAALGRGASWAKRSLTTIWRRVRRGKAPEAPEAGERTADDLARELSEKHPDWRPGLVRYLVREGRRHGKVLEGD